MNLADLSKDTLVELTRIVNDGSVGDTARNAKQHYVDLLAKQDVMKVEAAYATLVPTPEAQLAAALRAFAPQGVKREDVEKIVAEYLAVYMTSDTTHAFLTRLVHEQMVIAFKHVAAYIELGIKEAK
jgi:hypothetical protein